MPYPRQGESEQDYVSRFMASEEARRDYPDEKQRAAVAYSMFKERKNENPADRPCACKHPLQAHAHGGTGKCEAQGCDCQKYSRERANDLYVCPDCGAEMVTSPQSELIRQCAGCGSQRVVDATPPVEDLRNLCPVCHHAIEPDHDEFGCTAPECTCAEARQLAISEPRDVLPNAEGQNPDCKFCGHDRSEHKADGCHYDIGDGKLCKDAGYSWKPCRAFVNAATPFKPGDSVRHRTLGWQGRVMSVGADGAPIVQWTRESYPPVGATTPEDTADLVLANAERGNSYGNYNIQQDLQRGKSVSDCAKEIHRLYPDIDMARAMRMVEAIQKHGADVQIDWTKHGEGEVGNSIVDIRPSHWNRMSVDNRRRLLADLGQTADPTLPFSSLPANVQRYLMDSACDTKEYGLENTNSLEADAARMWDALSADEIEELIGHGNFTVPVDRSGKAYPFAQQSAAIKREWIERYRDAHENANAGGPFDQPNKLGCNGCDDIKAPLNKDGYCKRCASQQGLANDDRREKYSEALQRLLRQAEQFWVAADADDRARGLQRAGLTADLAGKDWAALPEDAKRKIAERMDDGYRHEMGNAAPVLPDDRQALGNSKYGSRE